MVPLQSCIRRGYGGGGYITALKGISIPIVNQSLLRKSRLTPGFHDERRQQPRHSHISPSSLHSIPVKGHWEEARCATSLPLTPSKWEDAEPVDDH